MLAYLQQMHKAAAKPKGRKSLGYDATEERGRRKPGQSIVLNEDEYLAGGKRIKLQFNASEIYRNFSIVRWAVARHLDYVSTFTFQATTGIDALDDRLEALMGEWAKPDNCDVAGRMSLHKIIRMAEAQRTLRGDILIVKLRDGRLQLIESDRVKTPTDLQAIGIEREDIVEGIVITKAGRAVSFAVNKRLAGGRYEFERMVPRKYAIHFGYFDTVDQVRGIAPVSSALNSFRDVYENFDLALAKSKVAQLFGIKLTRKALDAAGVITEVGSVDPEESGESGDADGEACEDAPPRYQVDFGQGPLILDMDPGDDADFLENKTPSTEFQTFMNATIGAAIKALDLPFSFYDESHSNYSGSRQALLQYNESAKIKRQEIKALLDHLTQWRIGLWVMNGELELPAGMTIFDLKWDWIHAGMPWIDPVKEKTADIMGIGAGLDNPEDVCRAHGGDVYTNIDKTARVLEYAQKKGVNLSYAVSQKAVDTTEPDEPPTKKKAG